MNKILLDYMKVILNFIPSRKANLARVNKV